MPRARPWPAWRSQGGLAKVVLWLLILSYVAFFSAYSLQRHATFNTYAADLSYFDQPMWNTLHGRFMERTLQDRQVPRMTDHFEPILVPLSLIYLLWNSAGALLVVQTLALALGALPIYWIARRALSSPCLALAFPAAYLLFPSLQAANLADFHADPLIVTPLLFAFWYATERRYRPMWAWALVAMLVKENLPALTFMLGFYLLLLEGGPVAAVRAVRQPGDRQPGGWAALRRGPWLHGLALMVVSLAWLFVAMFLVVGPIAREFYGTAGPVYLSGRYAGLGKGGLRGAVSGILAALAEPARRDYLVYLFGAVGWLALLAPEILLLGLPVLVANLLSGYPAQYSGELHYSAPLVPIFVVAAAYGARRLIALMVRWFAVSPGRRGAVATKSRRFGGAVAVLAVLWLLGWSLASQIERGGPLSAATSPGPRLPPTNGCWRVCRPDSERCLPVHHAAPAPTPGSPANDLRLSSCGRCRLRAARRLGRDRHAIHRCAVQLRSAADRGWLRCGGRCRRLCAVGPSRCRACRRCGGGRPRQRAGHDPARRLL